MIFYVLVLGLTSFLTVHSANQFGKESNKHVINIAWIIDTIKAKPNNFAEQGISSTTYQTMQKMLHLLYGNHYILVVLPNKTVQCMHARDFPYEELRSALWNDEEESSEVDKNPYDQQMADPNGISNKPPVSYDTEVEAHLTLAQRYQKAIHGTPPDKPQDISPAQKWRLYDRGAAERLSLWL
jgi:hypothetical protein